MKESGEPLHDFLKLMRESLVQVISGLVMTAIVTIIGIEYARFGLNATIISLSLVLITILICLTVFHFSSKRQQHNSPLKNKKTYDALARYLRQQKENILQALAPGSINLLVKDVIGDNGLFISLPWKILNGETRSDYLVEYLIDALLNGQRVLILGEAGQGKTTLLKRIFIIMIDHFLKEPRTSALIPVYIPLREFHYSIEDATQLLWAYLHNTFPLSFEDFVYLRHTNKIALIFDGFDEIKGELTLRAINNRAFISASFCPAILSCRKSFYELYLAASVIQECYLQKIELQPLTLTSPVIQYISEFCNKKQALMRQQNSTTPEGIVEVIRNSQELQDLAQRPLLLFMILDIFTNPREVSKDQWSIAKLYREYTEKWLKNEASKPDSLLNRNEKATLMRELAWSMYIARPTANFPYGLYQNITFTQHDVANFLERSATHYKHIPIIQMTDDLCFRTFLIANDGMNFYFIHKSFQEYYIAQYIFENLRNVENQIDNATKVLQQFLHVEVVTFLKDMLISKDLSKHDRDLIIHALINVYQYNTTIDNRAATIRQNASYYLAFLGTQEAIQFLEQAYRQEINKWVQRGMMVGLALFCGKVSVLEEYIDMIYKDAEAASINIGYHLVYYGDQALEEGYQDQGGERCEGTVRSIFRRIKSERHRNGWALDLLTLRTLVETRSTEIIVLDPGYLPRLREFMSKDHKEQGRSFHRERQMLQEVLKGAELL